MQCKFKVCSVVQIILPDFSFKYFFKYQFNSLIVQYFSKDYVHLKSCARGIVSCCTHMGLKPPLACYQDCIIYAYVTGWSVITEIIVRCEAEDNYFICNRTLQPVAFVYYITLHLTICIISNYVGFWEV